MTDPLSQVVEACTTQTGESSPLTIEPDDFSQNKISCNFCAQREKFRIFQRPTERRQWTNTECEALVGVHAFLVGREMPALRFLEKIIPNETERRLVYKVGLENGPLFYYKHFRLIRASFFPRTGYTSSSGLHHTNPSVT